MIVSFSDAAGRRVNDIGSALYADEFVANLL